MLHMSLPFKYTCSSVVKSHVPTPMDLCYSDVQYNGVSCLCERFFFLFLTIELAQESNERRQGSRLLKVASGCVLAWVSHFALGSQYDCLALHGLAVAELTCILVLLLVVAVSVSTLLILCYLNTPGKLLCKMCLHLSVV